MRDTGDDKLYALGMLIGRLGPPSDDTYIATILSQSLAAIENTYSHVVDPLSVYNGPTELCPDS